MQWTAKHMDRLHEFYGRYIDGLRADIVEANRSLGSSRPEHTHLEHLGRHEFETLLHQPTDDPEVARMWVRRIIRGHEHEFPGLDHGPSGVPRRRTGT